MIPPQIRIAKRVLSEPAKFGNETHINARKVLEQFHEHPCPYCVTGIVQTPAVGRYVCQSCEGTGSVWVRR